MVTPIHLIREARKRLARRPRAAPLSTVTMTGRSERVGEDPATGAGRPGGPEQVLCAERVVAAAGLEPATRGL